MLNVITGAAGSGKSQRLMSELDKLINKNPEQKIIFIVPEQFSYESDKKLYNKLGAGKFNKILSLSFTSLAKEIFEKHGGRSGEYADDIQKFIIMNKAVKSVLKSGSLQFYERQAKRPNFINDALAVVNEFRQCAVSPEKLSDLCNGGGSYSEKISDLSMIYTAYDKMLTEAGLKDSLTDISEAAATAQGNDYFKDTIIFFDEFESFTGDQYELIDVMFSQANDIYLSIRHNIIESPDYSIYDSADKTLRSFKEIAKKHNMEENIKPCDRLYRYNSGALEFINHRLYYSYDIEYGKTEDVSVIQCRDLYEETEFTAAQIKELIIKHGYKYNEIAVVSRQLDEYAYIIDSVFKKYDIPFYTDIKKKASHTSLMQFMISVVNLIAEKSPSLEAVLTFIKTMPKITSYKKINTLEEYAFEWNLKGRDFFSPFTLSIDEMPYIEEYRKNFMEPITQLREKCSSAKCSEICRYIYEFLYESKIPLDIVRLHNKLADTGFINEAKEQKRIWDSLMNMLEVFSDIGGDVDIKEFSALWQASIENITFSTPPQTLDGVHVAKAHTARLASPKAVFVLGVNEGYFPYSPKSSGLLSDKDRIKFKEAKVRLSRSSEELLSDEKLVVYKSLTHASDKLYLTYPQNDSRGAERFPSSLINHICSFFKNNIHSKASDKDILFYSSTPQAAYSSFVKNYDRSSAHIKALECVLSEDEGYKSKIDYLYEVRHQKDFAIKNTELVKKLYGESLTISPTNFELFNKCRFQFFCKTGLKLKKPERREIKPLETGNIVHYALEHILSSCMENAVFDKEKFLNLDENTLMEMTDKFVLEYTDRKLGGDIKRTKRFMAVIKEIKFNIVKIVTHLKEEFLQSKFVPVAIEKTIDNKAILKTDNGVEIFLKGKVDRVDIFEQDGEKYIRVVDYKTGKKDFSIASLLEGVDMQMILYLFSLTGENGEYKDYNPAGVLYMPSREIKNEMDRTLKKDELEQADIKKLLNRHYKMKGVILRERTVLNAMEENIGAVYIPARIMKNDCGEGEPLLEKKSTTFSSEGFKKLREHTYSLLTKLSEELYNGNISADPLFIGKENICEYCDYRSVCGNDTMTSFRELPEDAEDRMLKIVDEFETDEQMEDRVLQHKKKINEKKRLEMNKEKEQKKQEK